MDIRYINDSEFYKHGNALNLQATTLKNTNINEAIICLRRALCIYEDNSYFDIGINLKLMGYLAIGGYLDDLRTLMDQLLEDGLDPYNEISDPIIGLQVYDKARVIYKKLDYKKEAMICAVMNWVCEVYTLDSQSVDYEWYLSEAAKDKLLAITIKNKFESLSVVSWVMNITANRPKYEPLFLEWEIRAILP